MTNFNEKLDDVVSLIGVPLPIEQALHAKDTAKQAITSLIKELVAEAKPKEMDSFYEKPIVDEFEQNLLKEFEE